MKKVLFTALLFLLLGNVFYGQDKIIRKNGETISCRITSIDSVKIELVIKRNKAHFQTYTKLSDVSSYRYEGKFYYLSEPEKKAVRQNKYASDNKRSSKNGINIGFIKLQTTSLSLNYERLIENRHGLVIGIPVININDGKEKGFSFNYRRHFKNTMSSGYFGVFINYSNIDRELKSTTTTTSPGTSSVTNSKDYGFSQTNFIIGPNIGRSWITDSGFNFSMRIGYGIPLVNKFEWIESPEDEIIKNDLEKIMKIISGFDAELSVGFSF